MKQGLSSITFLSNLIRFPAVQYAVAMGLRVLAIGEDCLCLCFMERRSNLGLDTGDAKKKLCVGLGAEKWIDFKESSDLVKDVQAATDGLGPEAAIIAAGDVRWFITYLVF